MALFGISDLAVSAVMMFAGSTVLSALGFGIGISTTPVLLMALDAQTVVVTVNTISVLVFVLILFQTRRYLLAREMTPVTIAGLLGVPLGVLILNSASESALRISITALIILLTIAFVFRTRVGIRVPRALGPVVGFVVGLLLISLGIGGPLVVLFLLSREWTRHVVRASLAFYFLAVALAGVIGYGVAGLFTEERISLILIVTVPTLLGFAVGTMLAGRMSERVFQHAVVAVIIVTSAMVLGREVAGG